MSDEKTRALIADLREYATALRASVHVHHTGADLIEKAADALSALTVPAGDARERLAEEIAKHELGEDWADDGISFVGCSSCGQWFGKRDEGGWDRAFKHVADAILAAFPALSRDIAGEIEAEDEASGPFPDQANAYYDGLRRAAEIARNGR